MPISIKYFESEDLKLNDALDSLMAVLNQMKSIPGEFGKGLITKVDAIVNRNPDLKVLYQLYEDNPELSALRYVNLLPHFTFALITRCDDEQSFSAFKDILTSKRTSFTLENLEKTVFVNLNSHYAARYRYARSDVNGSDDVSLRQCPALLITQ